MPEISGHQQIRVACDRRLENRDVFVRKIDSFGQHDIFSIGSQVTLVNGLPKSRTLV